MYINKNFIQLDAESITEYIKENGFATIISTDENDIFATHIPLMLGGIDDDRYLHGHIAAPNEQSSSIKNGAKVLAIFIEKHTYISSSWYNHVNVPTWNYIAVHITGRFEILDDAQALASLNAMVDKYEAHSQKPFHISQMSDKEIKSNLRGITPFKIKIDKIEASWKLSQNRDDINYFEIIKKLRDRGDLLSINIADEMEKLRKNG
jgi:transcriptional regulator